MQAFRIITIALLALGTSFSAAADTVTLRSGAKFNGKVVRQDSSQVILSDTKGNLRTFAYEDIAKVEMNDAGKKAPPPAKPAADPGTQAPPPATPASAKPADAEADQAAPKLNMVVAEGVGKDAATATKDALRQAVSQVVGVLVMAKDVVDNDQLISSKILTYSDGYVERYEPIGTPTTSDGLTRVKIKAWVQQGKLSKDLTANAIPVKEVDARSMQGQSDTTADQARSAEELVVALFTDYPAKLLVAEPLEPKRISGDETATTFEVPVRVRIDDGKWKAWVAEAKKVLDPISTKKGTENWNMRMTGWQPLSGPRTAPPSTDNGKTATKPGAKGSKGSGAARGEETADQKQARALRENPWLERFVPEQERKGGAIAIDEFPAPLAAATSARRVLAVLDSIGGKVSWWQLPEEAWAAVGSTIEFPHIDVRLLGTEPDSLAPPISNWTEEISEDRPGARTSTLFSGKSGVGGDRLVIMNSEFPDAFVWWECALKVSAEGKQWSLPTAERYFYDFTTLLFPGCATVIGMNGFRWHDLCVCPSTIFPFRFSVPKDMIPANGKMNVEATIRLSAGKD
jgi:hypothetical protein